MIEHVRQAGDYLQRPVEVPESRRWDDLEKRIHAVEHELLPEAIRLIAAGAVRIDDRNERLVRIDRAASVARKSPCGSRAPAHTLGTSPGLARLSR